MSNWPRRYHPASIVGGVQTPDRSCSYLVVQLTPATWDLVAQWSGGMRMLDGDGNQAVAIGTLENVVHLGDYLVEIDTGQFEIELADGFNQKYLPVP